MIVELRWHSDKQVYIASLFVFVTGNRTKKAHGADAKPRLQLGGMSL